MRDLGTTLALAATLGLAAGCGDEAPRAPVPVPAVSEDAPLHRHPFTLGEGDGIRLAVRANMTIEASGAQDRSASRTVGTTFEFRCTEVTPAGDRVAGLRMLRFDVDGVASDAESADAVGGTMTIGADRVARAVEWGGGGQAQTGPSSNPFMTGGLTVYLPLPLGGMRVGETVALPSQMPANVLAPPLQRAVEQSRDGPQFRGTYTLRAVGERGGVLVGDFDIDLSLKFSGTIRAGTEDLELLVDMSCKGTQSFALGTGLPVGRASSRVVQRVELEAGGPAGAVRTTADIHAECEPIK